ncbi:MAG: hypothetical protein LBV43_04895 [Prevotella sp.]|jgi:hypothetical protein|nr:hypothetical protein [Prevotella sp.]
MTIADIKKQMTDPYITNDTVKELYGLQDGLTFDDQFSSASLESIIFDDVATALWVNRQVFEQHKTDVSAILKEQMTGTANWYAWKAKQFQYGQELVQDTDYYDNTGLTSEQITAMQVVKYAAAVESQDKSIIYLKIVTEKNGNRQPLSAAQLTAFKSYLNAYQYAGVRVMVINDPADHMKQTIDIYYDPQVLDESGKRLDGNADTPVQDAIRNYLKNLPFNGMYTNQALVDTLQVLDGVVIAEIKFAASRYGAYTVFTEINAREVAHAGYYQISDVNLILNFIPNEEIL